MSNKIIPCEDFVLVQIVAPGEEITTGGIVIPAKAAGQRDAIAAQVLAVGPGRTTEYGTKILADFAPGDSVLIPRGSGTEVSHATGAILRIMRGVEILAKLEESRIVGLT